MEVTRVKQRAYIKIAILRERNAMECHSELVKALGNNARPYRTVARWTDLVRAVIEQLMNEDRRWTLLELERASGIEKRTTVPRILRNELHLRKIAARCVSHALTEVQRITIHRSAVSTFHQPGFFRHSLFSPVPTFFSPPSLPDPFLYRPSFDLLPGAGSGSLHAPPKSKICPLWLILPFQTPGTENSQTVKQKIHKQNTQ
ncbi:histone-lysine N-methyltransferase SETMAR [Trichonephila clavipes]|nr:histone-lysine N-methyltransferase SETMAR [Trichonephila clavipes]